MTVRLLTAREVADMFGVTSETVQRWTRDGKLPAVRLGGTPRGRLRYEASEVDGLLERWNTVWGAAEQRLYEEATQ